MLTVSVNIIFMKMVLTIIRANIGHRLTIVMHIVHYTIQYNLLHNNNNKLIIIINYYL